MSSIDFDAKTRSWTAAAPRGDVARANLGLLLVIVGAACLGQLMAAAKLQAVWSTGAFFDTDDAMRAVQVRDLLAGQGWFDMTQYRLDPPGGVFMHWSRVVDVPLVLLTRMFGLVTDPTTSERMTRLLFPLMLTVALFALVVALCERLLGRAARFPALAAVFFYGPAAGQFAPGRIDHHAPQIVLLLLCLGGLCHALLADRARHAFAAGLALSLSLAISVENVPFFVPLVGALVLLWIIDSSRIRAPMLAFTGGLVVALPLFYAATIAPARWLLVAGDALSLAQACAVIATSVLLAGLAAAGSSIQNSVRVRAIVACGTVGCVGAILCAAFPVLFQTPFADLDPFLRTYWLDGVEEAQPLLRKLRNDPLWTIGVLGPALVGLAGSALALSRAATAAEKASWFLLLVASGSGVLASGLMIRTLSAALAVSLPGALALALVVHRGVARRVSIARGPLAFVAVLLATSGVGWSASMHQLTVVLNNIHAGSTSNRSHAADVRQTTEACTSPHAYTRLASLPPGLVLAEPDLGSYILAHTPHSVLAGAYHRNQTGMRTAIDALLASTDEREKLTLHHVAYVVFCRSGVDRQYVIAAPDGLAAQLAAAHPPTWLRQRDAETTTLDIYEVNSVK